MAAKRLQAHVHDYSVVDYHAGYEIWECFKPNCPKRTKRVHVKE